MKEIEKIIQHYDLAKSQGIQMALGTVVKVEGSAYRRIGARLLVSENGVWTGGISGGCLEGDALKRAKMAILNNKNSIVVYDTLEDDPHQIGVGLGCNGRIEVLFTPIDTDDSNNQIEFLKTIINKRKPTVLLQILQAQKTPHFSAGQFFIESTLKSYAEQEGFNPRQIESEVQAVFYKRKSKVFSLENHKGKRLEILFEHIRPKIKLICVGDNYDVHAMVNVVNELGWMIHLIGNFKKIGKELTQKVVKCTDIKQLTHLEVDEYTAIVLMSHDYKTDLNILKKIIPLDVPYIGLLGPKKRTLKMNADLEKTGISIDLTETPHVYAPIGLDIGAETPEEIAVAVTAEIISVFRNRAAGFLKNRKGTIH